MIYDVAERTLSVFDECANHDKAIVHAETEKKISDTRLGHAPTRRQILNR